MKMIFLGTASYPSINRNSQGILIELEKSSLLIDCGEGIQRQLLIGQVDISKLKNIFITHEHMDHIDGLTGVLAQLIYQTDVSVNIYATSTVTELIKTRLTTCKPELDISRYELIILKHDEDIYIDNISIKAFRTIHTYDSCGFRLSSEGKSIVCSGDFEINNEEERLNMIRNFEDADIAVLDTAHSDINTISSIIIDAKIKLSYLLPLNIYYKEDDINNLDKTIIIAKDFEEVEV